MQLTPGGSGHNLDQIQWELHPLLPQPALMLGVLGNKPSLLCISFKLPFALFCRFVAPVLAKTWFSRALDWRLITAYFCLPFFKAS